MTDTPLKLGKNDKYGSIDFGKLRSGITKKDLDIENNSVLSNIFDSIDNGGEENGQTKGNGRLERNELQAFIDKIKELAGNDKLSKREAKNYEIDGEKLGKNKEELLVFLNKLAELTKGVKQITNDNGSEIVTFEDGHTEQILANGNKIITKKQDGQTVTTTVDEDNYVLEETTEDDNFVTTTKNNPVTHKKQEVVTKNKNNNATVTTQYEEDGETPKSKEEVADDTTTRFIYNKDTQTYVPVSQDRKYPGSTKVVHTEYDQERSTEDTRVPKYTTVTEDGKLVSKTVGDKTVEYDGNGNTYVIVQPDERDAGKIAQKFGCSKEKLVELNGNRVFFNVGEKVKVPSQLEPDAPELQDRLSSEEAIKKFEEEQEAKRKAEEAARAARARAAQQARERAEAEKTKQGGQAGSTGRSTNTGGSTGTTQPKKVTKTRKKYDTKSIRTQAQKQAHELHAQICGASVNSNTIGMLESIDRNNIAFVCDYYNKFGISLAQHLDNEWGLDINDVKEHVCKKLKAQMDALGIKLTKNYTEINTIKGIAQWIDVASKAIIKKMDSATETYTVTEGEKAPLTEGEKQVQKNSAQQIVNELKKAISGLNDYDAIRMALNKIDTPEKYEEVNRLLAAEGYKADNLYSSLEKFMKEEFQRIATDYSNEDLEKYVQKWISAKPPVIRGKAAIDAQARLAARVIIDGGDGMGTNPKTIKKGIYMIKAPEGQGKDAAKRVYEKVNQLIAGHKTFYGIGTRSKGLIDYLDGELCKDEIKYLKGILGENDAIQGKEKADAVKDLVEESVSGAGTDIDGLKQAIKAIRSPEDRKAVEEKLEEYCKKKGIKKQLKGQSALQAILYDECDTLMGLHRDHKEIRKFNEMLISQGAYGDKNSQEVIALRAEQAVLQILEGDFDNVMDAVQQIKDPKVLAKVNEYLRNNLINGESYTSLEDFLNKKFGANSVNSDLVMAELAGNNLVSDEKASDVAFRLINNSDFNKRAMGLKAIRTEKTAKLVDAKLKANGSSLQQVVDKFNKEKAEYKAKATLWDGLATVLGMLGVGGIAEDISDGYRKNTDSSDNTYIEAATAIQIPPEKSKAYKTAIEAFEQNLKKMKADYQEALDSQGAVSDAVNRFCEIWNIGTTRDEIEARIEHDTETLRLLKLAAEGKLAKMVNGKAVAVSFEEVFKERQSAHISANGTSISSVVNTVKPKEATEFDPVKVEKVANKAETMGAMDAVKDLVSVCWGELDSASKSNDKKQFASAIYNTLNNLSQLIGQTLSLKDYGYKLNSNGIIVDTKGNEVSVDKLKEIINQLKQSLSEISKNVLDTEIPLNSNSKQATGMLEAAFEKKMEGFKQEYRDAFGQDAPDSVIESYVSTINTGKTIVNFGAIIGAAILTAGSSLAVFGAVAGVSMGLNVLEHSTDADGYTKDEFASDAEQALWDGALAALGMRVGMFAEVKIVPAAIEKWSSWCSHLFKNPAHIHKASVLLARAEAAGFEISSDSVQSFVQMYAQNGDLNSDEFWHGFAMSLIGNTAGHVNGARGDIKQGPKGADAPSHKELPPSSDNNPKQIGEPEQPRQIGADGQGSHNVDGGSDAGKAKPKEEPKVKDDGSVSDAKQSQAKQTQSFDEITEKWKNSSNEDLQKAVDNIILGKLNEDGAVLTQNHYDYLIELLHSKGLDSEIGRLNKFKITHSQNTELQEIGRKNTSKDKDKVEVDYEKQKQEKINQETQEAEKRAQEAKKAKEQEAARQAAQEKRNAEAKSCRERIDSLNEENMTPEKIEEIRKYINSIEDSKDRNYYLDELDKKVQSLENSQKSGASSRDNANSAGHAQQQQSKTYAEMNENELFAEYQRLNNEVKYGGLSNSEKVVNINKMKEITARLESKGFRIEGDKIVNTKQDKARTDNRASVERQRTDNPSGTSAKSKFSAEELKQKLGKKLYRSYKAVERTIAKLKTLADFNKIKNYITTKFKGFTDVANDLMNQLIAKAKKLGIYVSKKINIKSSTKHFSNEQINNFLNEPYMDSFTLAESLKRQGFKPTEANSIHSNWKSCVSYYNEKSKILLTYMYDENGNLVSKGMTYATKKMNGHFERLSDVNINYDKNGNPHTINIDGKKESVQYDDSEENVRGSDNASSGSRGADASSSAGQGSRPELDKYKVRKGKRTNDHLEYVDENKDLFKGGEIGDGWMSFETKNHKQCPWKMHLYSVDELDWQQLSEVVIPYLKEHGITFKTLDPMTSPEALAEGWPEQAGKAFTIYPHSNAEMAQIARDLDYIIRNNNLQTSGSHITGDRQMGSTGRLFYRYEWKSGKNINDTVDPSKIDYKVWREKYYDPNRGEGKYLADDMTEADDIWHDFDPSDGAAKASRSGSSSQKAENKSSNPAREAAYAKFDKNAPLYETPANGLLNQNAQYALDLDNMPQLTLRDGTVVDLNDPQIKNRIASLKEGEFITIGRDGDIQINASDLVSRHHILITRHNGQIVMKDVSTYGNTTCYTRPKASQGSQNAGSSNRSGQSSDGVRRVIYEFKNWEDLKRRMNDVLQNFSEQTQNNIIRDLREKGKIRLQKNGKEYVFKRSGYNVLLEEVDIKTKYNIKEHRVDDYTTLTEYTIKSNDDIFWAICGDLDELEGLSQSEMYHLRNTIVNHLSNGRSYTFMNNGIRYNFTIDKQGHINLNKFEKARYDAENPKTNQSGSPRPEEGNAGRPKRPLTPEEQKLVDEANAYIEEKQMALKLEQDRLNLFKSKVPTKEQAREYMEFLGITEDLASLPLQDAENVLKRAYRKQSIAKHPDRNGSTPEAVQEFQKVGDAYNQLKNYIGASDSEIVSSTKKIDDLRKDIDAKQKEIDDIYNKKPDNSRSNEAKAEEATPDEAAATRAAKAEEMKNASVEEFYNLIEKNYDNLRYGNYSWKESVSNISEYDLVHPTNPNIKVVEQDGWFYRNPRGKVTDNIKERISLNVVADKRLLDELDNLLLNGEYINRYGQRVKVKVPKRSYYKTPTDFTEWVKRHDPITMYFSDKVSQELYDAIAEISQKYARPSSTPLPKSRPNKPWIAVDKEYSAEEFKALYNEALKLNKNLAEAIKKYVNSDGDWISSSGAYAACKQMIEDYKATVGV